MVKGANAFFLTLIILQKYRFWLCYTSKAVDVQNLHLCVREMLNIAVRP